MCTSDSSDGMVLLDGTIPAYRIVDHERLPPFLMTVVSAWDHWMFVSSTGGLTAGRREPGRSLFPYETDDRLHHLRGVTGPLTVLRVHTETGVALWEPFDRRRAPTARRHLTKSLAGDLLEREEVHLELGLTFRERWCTSERFGFVRRCSLERHPGREAVTVELLDGLLNLMPPHVELSLQQGASCLVDAYKMAERQADTTLALYSLTSRIVDRAEPAEALRGTVAWCEGLEPAAVLLSDQQVESFRSGGAPTDEERSLGRRFAYLVTSRLHVAPSAPRSWHVVADVYKSAAEVVALQRLLARRDGGDMAAVLTESVALGRERLRALVASADGVQDTGHPMDDAHHFANVMFNIMRGGVFLDGHRIPRSDFTRFLHGRNAMVAERHREALEGLPDAVEVDALLAWAEPRGDADLVRLAYEYLPLTFSRRHGDPSRPWNKFTIRTHDAEGQPRVHYEGNWRDIFQNWEALLMSFPGFIEPVVAKFVNASTADGFNPYRITREGIDWEVPDPDDPWANIGYWGDHQTIYLLKLLELSRRFHPRALDALLGARIFSTAEVPYRIAPYAELFANPHETIRFDQELDAAIAQRTRTLGADGKLLQGADGTVHHVTLTEKLLICALARLSNLVADGGIWMNTQRPEWNDANNALVGYGLSMVTLCYLRRFVGFFRELVEGRGDEVVELSPPVAIWLERVTGALHQEASALHVPVVTPATRRRLLDQLGEAFSDYRESVYSQGLGAPSPRRYEEIATLLDTALPWLDHAIDANRRDDGLYHAYNLLSVASDGGVKVDTLYEMLEGQVAVLSSGALSPKQTLGVIDALFSSELYREDQRSFILYPRRDLPSLLERGVVPEPWVTANPLLVALQAEHPRPLVVRADDGKHRFGPDFRNAVDLAAALDALETEERWASLVAEHRGATLELYEDVFQHRSFTGRSGTMVAYEGLGSTYWHMVSKLLLAVQETALRTEDPDVAARLREAYERVRSGLSASKTAAEYGAFPTDPYSHTPAHRGAQQPGMTGQVKEEVLTRWAELGVEVDAGRLRFRPRIRPLADGANLTFCGTRVDYREGVTPGIAVHRADGEVITIGADELDAATSADVFARRGVVERLVVTVPAAQNDAL